METPPLFELDTESPPWNQGRVLGFDVETTSRFPAQARIVTAALVVFDDTDTTSPRVREWLVDPGVAIPEETTAIHGISTAYAQQEGLPAPEAVRQIVTALGREIDDNASIVVMNAPYDISVLAAECRRYGFGMPDMKTVIDPLVIDKHLDPFRRGKRRLSDLCSHYDVDFADAHSATPDAIAAVGVALALAKRYPDLHIQATDLHRAQIQWKADQAASFQDYLRRTNPDAMVDPAWPGPVSG